MHCRVKAGWRWAGKKNWRPVRVLCLWDKNDVFFFTSHHLGSTSFFCGFCHVMCDWSEIWVGHGYVMKVNERSDLSGQYPAVLKVPLVIHLPHLSNWDTVLALLTSVNSVVMSSRACNLHLLVLSYPTVTNPPSFHTCCSPPPPPSSTQELPSLPLLQCCHCYVFFHVDSHNA